MSVTADQVIEVLQQTEQGLELSEITRRLGLRRPDRREVGACVRSLVRQGRVARQGRSYSLLEQQQQPDVISGVLHVTPGGRGFVDRGDAFDDVLVSPYDLGPALDGDTVVVQTWQGRRRQEGEVIEVESRGRVRITGDLRQDDDGELWVAADDPRLPDRAPVDHLGPAKVGDVVLASITTYPEHPGQAPRVSVTRVLGEPGNLITEVARSVAGAGVDEGFPPEVERACGSLARGVTDEERARRMDLRHLPFVTIDPQRARDFDDAVALEPGPDGATRVWVAVADVAHYVEEGSAVDLEARRRGCSLYLPDRAIHMLPEALSAGICSLVPHEDRLAMVVRVDVSPEGEVGGQLCAAAVIHSRGRLDYQGVAAALQGDFRGRRAGYTEHVDQLQRLQQVAAALRSARLARGSLDLDLPESEVLLDEDDPGRVRDVRTARPDTPVKRAYGLIEELMLAANEAVGSRFKAAGEPAIWRIHPRPDPGRLAQLAGWLGSYGVPAEPERLRTERGMGRLLARLDDHRARRGLAYLVLRALKQAVYGANNVGHFGLASRTYLHFTSPIRRYPDLQVHRLLKRLLRQQGQPAGREVPTEELGHKAQEGIARESTLAERRAVTAEREVRRLYCASLMRDRIGDSLSGTVTGLGPPGLFVALDHPAVEGLLPLERLGGRDLELDEDALRILDHKAGRCYSLGDRVQVTVADASVTRRRITLEPGEDPGWHEADPKAVLAPQTKRHRGKRGQRHKPKFPRRRKGRR